MKKLIALLCVGLAVGASAEVEYVVFSRLVTTDPWSPQSITLNEGEIIEFISAWTTTASDDLQLRSSVIPYITRGDNTYPVSLSANQPFAGPCTIVYSQASKVVQIIFKITRLDAVVETSPMNIISLPDDNNGDVDLLVESSTDLQNWTPVYSGSAGTSNDAAFFRTRLIQN